MLEFIIEALDSVAHVVEGEAEGVVSVDVASAGDDWHGILFLDHRLDPFSVLGLIAKDETVGWQEFAGDAGNRPPVTLDAESTRRCLVKADLNALRR